jgi:hypothetical protein
MTEQRRDLAAVARALADRLSWAPEVTQEDRYAQASKLLAEIDVGQLIDDLEVAERILATGEQFHSVERFFVEGSPEQRYLARLAGGDERDREGTRG